MARLIDADALMNKIKNKAAKLRQLRMLSTDQSAHALEKLAEEIDHAPTVDAVEVVRCCECKHCEVVNNDTTFAICKAPPKTLFLPFDIDTRTHFCSYGERKVSE